MTDMLDNIHNVFSYVAESDNALFVVLAALALIEGSFFVASLVLRLVVLLAGLLFSFVMAVFCSVSGKD